VLGGIAFAIVYSTLGIPLARLDERIGRKWVLSGSLLVWSALTAVGAAYCWGRGESGQLGVPPPTSTCPFDGGPLPCIRVPVAANGGQRFTVLTGGGAHTCGLTDDGTAWCWGNNGFGQLGEEALR